ncbi:MAG TPA: Clp protease N-terminal domain-containing protein [Gemmatimonadaceae bacterium]|nr:Clp protease N-terminal domain-containing protein [Gemmatimonadaceae bacterium]
MFERFTEQARRVVFFARYEASQLGSIDIDTEHVLLGLIREGKGLTDRLFTHSGIAVHDIRAEVLRRVPARPKTSSSAEIPFSPAAMRVLQHAAQEADRLSHDYIATEHLLLGLLSEQGTIAADALISRGLRLDRVREQIVELLNDGEPREHPGPPGIPANTFKWPWLRFVPSRSVHILYSELKPPQQPVTNYSGPGLQAYGYTLTEAIVAAWRGNRWHIDISDGLDDGTRYDFYVQLAQAEPSDIFVQIWRDGIERQFELSVTRETRPRDVWVASSMGRGGPMLRDYGKVKPGSIFGTASFNLVMARAHDAPLFPLEPFAVHSVPFFCLANWFEEFLGGQVIDETDLRGLYGFELTRTAGDRDELIHLLREQAGVSITRAARDTPTLVVRRR